jgi:tetratricopeptide (TPR) repeat protein
VGLPRVLLALLAALAATGCAGLARHPAPAPELPPHEALALIGAEVSRQADRDPYRSEPAHDALGQNVFRVTLARLEAFGQAHADVDPDIVQFTRGQALERLGDFVGAIEAYGHAADSPDSPLADKARVRAEALFPLRSATRAAEKMDNLGDYFADLEARQKKLADLEKERAGTWDASLARRELERLDVEYALALFRNRFVIENGAGRALDYVRAMLERHATSCRIYAHRLMLGRFYVELATDLTLLRPPDRTNFDMKLYENLATSARQNLTQAARADGYEEKIEAQAQLRVLEALDRRVRLEQR